MGGVSVAMCDDEEDELRRRARQLDQVDVEQFEQQPREVGDEVEEETQLRPNSATTSPLTTPTRRVLGREAVRSPAQGGAGRRGGDIQ
jgi:hypothetical protein